MTPPLPEPAERGSLTVAEKVVERVAGYAVTMVDGVGAAPRRVLGVSVGEVGRESAASVSAQVDGRVATVSATVAVVWPHSARGVAQQLRERIRADVLRLVDVDVAQVDLDVVRFTTSAARQRRVE